MYLSPRKKLFVETASQMFGSGAIISMAQLKEAAEKAGVPNPSWMGREKVGRNQFKLPSVDGVVSAPVTSTLAAPAETDVAMVNLVATNMDKQNLVPAPFEGFVAWGNYATLKKIVASNMFYPVFVTG